MLVVAIAAGSAACSGETYDDAITVDRIVGPVAIEGIECPEGGERLDHGIHVSAYAYHDGGEGAGIPGQISEINNVTRYEEDGVVIAWCGKSVGDIPENNIYGPAAGMIMIIPVLEACPNSQKNETVPCPGQPLEYDPRDLYGENATELVPDLLEDGLTPETHDA